MIWTFSFRGSAYFQTDGNRRGYASETRLDFENLFQEKMKEVFVDKKNPKNLINLVNLGLWARETGERRENDSDINVRSGSSKNQIQTRLQY